MIKYFIFPLILAPSVIAAQTDSEIYADVIDAYGLAVSLNKYISTHKIDCYSFHDTRSFSLYTIQVDSVLFMRDTTVYNDQSNLKEVKFIIFPETVDVKALDSEKITVFCHNSSFPEYLVATKVYSSQTIEYTESKTMPHVVGSVTCYKLNWWQKLRLKLGANPDKVFTKAKKRVRSDDPFMCDIKEN